MKNKNPILMPLFAAALFLALGCTGTASDPLDPATQIPEIHRPEPAEVTTEVTAEPPLVIVAAGDVQLDLTLRPVTATPEPTPTEVDAGTTTPPVVTPPAEVDAGTTTPPVTPPAEVDAGTTTPPVVTPPATPDAGTTPPVVTPPVVTPPATPDAGVPQQSEDLWLRTQGNRILLPNGQRWKGRGANLHDTRSCNACTGIAPSVAEVNRRMDLLVDEWKANFIRLDLESYETQAGRNNWNSVRVDPAYLQQVKDIVAHAMTKPGLRVMISLWIDPSFTSLGWPTADTTATWRILAAAFKDEPRVMFGLVNEPQGNFNGTYDAQVWQAMNNTVQAIRDVEGSGPRHLVSVQGTRGWSRYLDYYLTHPITAGGGQNVIYETHVYDAPSEFPALFERASQTLPVIIGEFGPANGFMTSADVTLMMQRARALDVPHLAWTFHQRCPPNLIQETAPGCGLNMPLRPTAWGQLFKDALALPW